MNSNCCGSWTQYLYTVFRVLVGGLFLAHGIQKFMAGATGLMLVAGVVETLVGLAVVLGLWVQWAAVLGIANMVGAIFVVHKAAMFTDAISAGNERVWLYIAAFLALIAMGPGPVAMQKDCACCEMEKPAASVAAKPAKKKKR